MRKKLVAGNWKMFTLRDSALALAREVVQGTRNDPRVDVLVCPPFPYLGIVHEVLKGTSIRMGAQNCYTELEGAFTGEIGPKMLLDVGCDTVILGHSERRRIMGEPSSIINQKVKIALEAGLKVIVCAGETKAERDAGQAHRIVEQQLHESLEGFPRERLADLAIAYEPVWAIGTGVHATPDQAQAMHGMVRGKLASIIGAAAAQSLVLLYGGSVKPDNAAVLMAQPDVDGVLVGGASLKAADFLSIYQAALAL